MTTYPAIQVKRRRRKQRPLTDNQRAVLGHLRHLIDSGQTASGRAGLYVRRKQRGQPQVQACPPRCRSCWPESRAAG